MPNLLPLFLIATIWCLSFIAAVTPIILIKSDSLALTYLSYFSVPVIFVFMFITIAGGLSRFAQRGIVTGTFPREALHKIYFLRRVFGICWTQVFYFKPLYAIALGIPVLKTYLFRIFGYKHSTQFIVYPDTWIRDLPVLKFGNGVYLSNRATIGTNICLKSGDILVDSIQVDEKGLVGHLAILAPGVKIGKAVEVGVSATIGIRTKLLDQAKVNPCCMVNHAVVVGENTQVGTMSYVGLKSVLGANLNVPAGANIPAGSVINTQAEMDSYYHSETKKLDDHVIKLRALFEESNVHEFKTVSK
jgi:carbonic anhydrase/acetyltransferase-like protein (isoleucine patch superfamily)